MQAMHNANHPQHHPLWSASHLHIVQLYANVQLWDPAVRTVADYIDGYNYLIEVDESMEDATDCTVCGGIMFGDQCDQCSTESALCAEGHDGEGF